MLRISEYIKLSLDKKIKPRSNIKIAIINLTNNCNLSCVHCYSNSKLVKSEDVFNESNLELLVKNVSTLNIKFVILSGGEPLLFPYIYELANMFKKQNINVSLSTNGFLIDESNIELIQKHFDYVGVSIDGTKTTHDKFRGFNGAYEQSIKSIELLKKYNIKVGLRFTLSAKNYKDILHIFDLSKSLDISKVYISHIVNAGRSSKNLDIPKSTHKALSELILEKSFSEEFYVVTGNNEQDAILLLKMFENLYKNYSDYLYENLINWGGNSSGDRLLNIDYKGNIKPDPFFNYTCCNILEKDFEHKLAKDDLFNFLRKKPRELKGKCKDCEFLNICNGGSRARAFNTFDDYKMEDPACFI